MSETGNKLIDAMEEAVAFSKGEIPAARMTFKGHTYVNLADYNRVRAALQAYVDHADEDAERLPCCQKIYDQAVAALGHQQSQPEKP